MIEKIERLYYNRRVRDQRDLEAAKELTKLSKMLSFEQGQEEEIVAGSQKPATISFPLKLLSILDSRVYEDIVRWRTHGMSFIVVDTEAFISRILKSHFRIYKMRSFEQELECWGFLKRRDGKGRLMNEFRHEKFHRRNIDLCRQMKRGGPRNRAIPNKISEVLKLSLISSSHANDANNFCTPHLVTSNEIMKAILNEEAKMKNDVTSFDCAVDCHRVLSLEIQWLLNKIHSNIQVATTSGAQDKQRKANVHQNHFHLPSKNMGFSHKNIIRNAWQDLNMRQAFMEKVQQANICKKKEIYDAFFRFSFHSTVWRGTIEIRKEIFNPFSKAPLCGIDFW